MTATFEDGVHVEIALAGHESVLGSSSMMGTKHSLNRVYMQVGGHGFTSRTGTASREFKRGEQFHDLTLRYLQAQFLQVPKQRAVMPGTRWINVSPAGFCSLPIALEAVSFSCGGSSWVTCWG